MTINITCDWCAQPIDGSEELSAEEYNRMGFEELPGDTHIVVESRYAGNDRIGRERPCTELWHFHGGACYQNTLRLIGDHLRWAEAQNEGPLGAGMPRWDGERLDDAPTGAVVEPAADGSTDEPKAADLTLERMRRGSSRRCAGTQLAELGIPGRAVSGLERSDIFTVEELVDRTDPEIRAVEGVGEKTMRQITEELASRGLSLREGSGIAEKVGARLCKLRRASGMSREDFARAFAGGRPWGTSETLSRQWEKGLKLPDDSAAQRIADLFGVSADWVMCREEAG